MIGNPAGTLRIDARQVELGEELGVLIAPRRRLGERGNRGFALSRPEGRKPRLEACLRRSLLRRCRPPDGDQRCNHYPSRYPHSR